MSLLDRVETCRRWRPEAYRPFMIGERRLGRVTHDFARRLADFPQVFEVAEAAVTLAPGLDDFARRTAAVAEVLAILRDSGEIAIWRDEPYPVLRQWDEAPLMTIERGAVPYFGVRGFGVHMNGLVQKPEGLFMWVGKRSLNKPTGPGKLDHLVAGGQPHGIGIRENLIKECAEEADIPESLARLARPVGMISYICEQPDGLRDDICFCYDLDLPADFTPRNTDGEVEAFYLWPIEQVMQVLSETDDFKFNVALVNIDCLLRRGLLSPDAADYQAIASGLRLPG